MSVPRVLPPGSRRPGRDKHFKRQNSIIQNSISSNKAIDNRVSNVTEVLFGEIFV